MAFAPPIALDYLRRAHAAGRLGHAYLLIGDGDEGLALAAQLAALVVQAEPGKSLTHRDVYVVEPESKSRRIVIEQVRDLENALRLCASAAGGRKVGIIREADRLVIAASNAFLKTLEEPPAESLLLLISALPESLPDTILSRCIKVVLLAGTNGAKTATTEETALLALLARHARDHATRPATLPVAYQTLRDFTGLLATVKARVQEEADTALEAEETRYAQTTDGAWLSDREAYYKTLVEARYLAERARLVEILTRWWGDILRHRTGGEETSPLREAPDTAAFAQRLTPTEILRRLSTMEELRENMGRNIQEALALEVAFLQMFGC